MLRTEGQLDERLFYLFRNRAELKKAYQDLQSQYQQLEDKLRNAEASTRRAEERLEAVERLMAKPEAGYNGLVYFQLRALWRACNDQLRMFAEELRKQQEDRERQKQIQRFNQERERKLADLNELIRRVKQESDRVAADIEGTEAELGRRQGIWNFFIRRELSRSLDERRAEHAGIRRRIEELFDRRIKIEGQPWPEFPGLSVEGKRAINVAVVALAHQLFTYFGESDISRLARDAVTRPIQDLKYGSEEDCTFLIRKIQKLMLGLRRTRERAPEVKTLAQEIRRHAEYRSEQETVPVASSLDGVVLDTGRMPGRAATRANVLMDEYWDLYEVFLR